MAGHQQLRKSRVVKIDSEESWDFYISQSTNQGCPVVVHFTAAWCIPSVSMKAFFEELALKFQDILFLVVDVDEVKEAATKMEVKAMPTFLLMRDGAIMEKLVGANRDEIRKRTDAFVHCIRSHKIN